MAEMCFWSGQLEKCETSVKEVLAHAKSIDDSMHMHLVWIQSLADQAQYDEHVHISMVVLKELGEQPAAVPNPGNFSNEPIIRKFQAQTAEEDRSRNTGSSLDEE